MIEVKKSPTADTRTCDWSKVSKETLFESSQYHINDVKNGIKFFVSLLKDAAILHDYDKIHNIDEFHKDFITGFKETKWWDNHRKISRHHLNELDGVPENVDLIDIIEYIVDCVMSGMARSGNVYEVKLSNEIFQKALQNSIKLLKKIIKIV